MQKITDFIIEKRKFIVVFYIAVLVLSAVGFFNVNVNYDMSKYLPKDSETREGLSVMEENFGELAMLTVMIDDLDVKKSEQAKKDLEKIDNVKSVTWIENDEYYRKGNHSKFLVTIDANTYSDEAGKVLADVRSMYDSKIYVSGELVDNQLQVESLRYDIPKIAMIGAVIILIILFALCDSWMAPILFLICICVAIVINMGSNVFLSSVSFMTFSTGALLQLSLSMDYSIMLMNRYQYERKKNDDPVEAMRLALRGSVLPISGSSVTTIVGLLVLLFMSFLIGRDLGLVLAKGVAISLVCIFTLLPGLTVFFDGLLQKSAKRYVNPNMAPLVSALAKARFVIIPLLVVVVCGCLYIKGGLGISFVRMFDNPDQPKIEKVFGVENQIAVLGKAGETEEFTAEAEKLDHVRYVQGWANTAGKKRTYSDMAEETGMDEAQIKLLYRMYSDRDNTAPYERVSGYELMKFAYYGIACSSDYDTVMDKERKKELSSGWEDMKNGRAEMLKGFDTMDENEKLLKKKKVQLEGYAGQIDSGLSKLNDGIGQIDSGLSKLNDGIGKTRDGLRQINEGLIEIDENIEAADELISTLPEGDPLREKLIEVKAELVTKKEEVLKQKAEVSGTLSKLKAQKESIEEQRKELAGKKKELVSQRKELLSGLKQINEGLSMISSEREKLLKSDAYSLIFKKHTASELSELMDTDRDEIESLLKIRRISKKDVSGLKLTTEEFLRYINDTVLDDDTFSASISKKDSDRIRKAVRDVEDSKKMLLSGDYDRVLVVCDLPSEGKETFAFVDRLKDTAERTLGGDHYILGNSAMGAEMNEGFADELNLVTILSVVAIFIVVFIAFRNPLIALVLVALIQGAVWITTAIVTLTGVEINYVALILVQCILMGATIDYGILLSSNYRDLRSIYDRREAAGAAMNQSIGTILTSGLILIACCVIIGIIMKAKITSQTCLIIACGASCAVVLTVFVLPVILYTFDGLLFRTGKNRLKGRKN